MKNIINKTVKNNLKLNANELATITLLHDIGVSATDDAAAIMQAIKDGIMDGTIVQNPYGHGYLSMLLLQYLSEGYKPKADAYFVDAGFAFATQENLETYNDDILAVTDQIKAELLDKYLEK